MIAINILYSHINLNLIWRIYKYKNMLCYENVIRGTWNTKKNIIRLRLFKIILFLKGRHKECWCMARKYT